MKRIKPHKFGKKLYRPKNEKLRLRKNVKGFRRYELHIKRCDSFGQGYYLPSKYLALR